MASDSGKDTWAIDARREYAEDPSAWLSKRFGWVREEVTYYAKYYGGQQEEQAKNFLQAVADSHTRRLNGLATQLIYWIGAIAIIESLSAGIFGIADGLVVGAICVGLIIAARVYWWPRIMQKQVNRLERCRRRFRELLDSVNDIRWQTRTEEVVAEDKAFLEKCKNTILFPSLVPYGRRENRLDLDHLETLYREYCCGIEHIHPPICPPNPGWQDCDLCVAADHVRKHVESALSALESQIQSTRQELVTRIDSVDAKSLIDDFRRWFEFARWRRIPQGPVIGMCESLRDRESWNFDEADTVRELCRDWEKFDPDESTLLTLSPQIFDKLSIEMGAAAKRCGQADTWIWYNGVRVWLADSKGTIAAIRGVIGRQNPEAMFREMAERYFGFSNLLPSLTTWGYDPKQMDREWAIAWKYISKARNNKYGRERDRELQAMCASLEES